MKKILLIVAVAMMAAVSIQAQIEPKVIEVLKKSQEKINNPQGTEIEMTVEATMVVKLTGMKVRTR